MSALMRHQIHPFRKKVLSVRRVFAGVASVTERGAASPKSPQGGGAAGGCPLSLLRRQEREILRQECEILHLLRRQEREILRQECEILHQECEFLQKQLEFILAPIEPS